MNPIEEARANLESLRNNPYPGRGLVVGMDETGKHIMQVAWIMGRSDNSRNRVYSHDGKGRVYTEAAVLAKMKDPTLIIYNTMNEYGRLYAVSNGRQTDDVLESTLPNLSRALSQRGHIYEPDNPNFTPRITATCFCNATITNAQITVLKKSPWSDRCDRQSFEYDLSYRGIGFCVTTYMGDGNPLPPFRGEPYLLPLSSDMVTIANTLWGALNENNRVALAVKKIDSETGRSEVHIINRFPKVS